MNTLTKSNGLHGKKTNNRWKWMAGATAVSAAAAATAQANSTVVMPLSGNFISQPDGDQLKADLLTMGNNLFNFATRNFGGTNYAGSARASIQTFFANNGGGQGVASFDGASASVIIRFKTPGGFGSGYSSTAFSYGTAMVMKELNIRFTDPSVNGGAVTDGLLKMVASARGDGEGGESFARVELVSFQYTMNMPSAVPEGGSTLALLALGAGGVMAFRQRRKAA